MKTLTELSLQCGAKSMDVFDAEKPDFETGLLFSTAQLQATFDAYIAQSSEPFGWLIRGGGDPKYCSITQFRWDFRKENPEPDCAWEMKEIIPIFTSPQPDQSAYIKQLEALSVSNLMLNVVPDLDGNGFEVYAKSIAEVENLLTKLDLDLEYQSAYIERLEKALADIEKLGGDDMNVKIARNIASVTLASKESHDVKFR